MTVMHEKKNNQTKKSQTNSEHFAHMSHLASQKVLQTLITKISEHV